jgi:hypothetical protein
LKTTATHTQPTGNRKEPRNEKTYMERLLMNTFKISSKIFPEFFPTAFQKTKGTPTRIFPIPVTHIPVGNETAHPKQTAHT